MNFQVFFRGALLSLTVLLASTVVNANPVHHHTAQKQSKNAKEHFYVTFNANKAILKKTRKPHVYHLILMGVPTHANAVGVNPKPMAKKVSTKHFFTRWRKEFPTYQPNADINYAKGAKNATTVILSSPKQLGKTKWQFIVTEFPMKKAAPSGIERQL